MLRVELRCLESKQRATQYKGHWRGASRVRARPCSGLSLKQVHSKAFNFSMEKFFDSKNFDFLFRNLFINRTIKQNIF